MLARLDEFSARRTRYSGAALLLYLAAVAMSQSLLVAIAGGVAVLVVRSWRSTLAVGAFHSTAENALRRQIASMLMAAAHFFLWSSEAGAQDVVRPFLATTYRCSFPVNASVDMRVLPLKPTVQRQQFDLIFDQVDLQKGTGRLIGNQGGSDVVVVPAAQAITLVESVGSGVLQITVIFAAKNADGSLQAVHSRHTVGFGGEPIPSQYYGSCKALL